MIGRYVVEIIMVLLCGLGLHSTEVAHVGGAEVLVLFKEVSHIEWYPLIYTDPCFFT
jgi:hypothetical protein